MLQNFCLPHLLSHLSWLVSSPAWIAYKPRTVLWPHSASNLEGKGPNNCPTSPEAPACHIPNQISYQLSTFSKETEL